MTASPTLDWPTFCTGTDWVLEGDQITVVLKTGRRQVIQVRKAEESYRLTTRIASLTDLSAKEDPDLMIWRRNRRVRLASFRITADGLIIGESHCPTNGLTPGEFQLVVHNLALEADRVEFLLTGKDVW